MTSTKVFLVGAGPGDPELLTLKAVRLLQDADVILHDSLIDPRILGLVRAGARRIDVGKRCGRHSMSQSEICRLLVAEALQGHRVVRLKGGDPMIFGRATEEMEAFAAHGITYEIVPGVTTATAAAAALRLSLTQRRVSRSLHILTGHGADGNLPPHDWTALVNSGGTLAVYMGAETLSGLATHFIEAGMNPSTPAIAIENVSRPDERSIRGTIASLPFKLEQAASGSPTLILVGEALREEIVQLPCEDASEADGLSSLFPNQTERVSSVPILS
jgi:uroporphyrin-III C-methyltransferase